MTDKDDDAAIKAAAKRVADRIKKEDNVAARDQEGKRIAEEAAKKIKGQP